MIKNILKKYKICKQHREQITNNSFSYSLSVLSKEDFKVLMDNGKRISSIFGIEFKGLENMPYEVIKNIIPEYLKKADVSNMIIHLLKEKGKLVSLSEINAYNHNHLLSFVFWIKDQLTMINELEREHLTSPPNMKMINAGVGKLDQLGDFVLIDNLVKEWQVYTHDEIRKMPYSFIFDKQLKSKIESEVNERYQELIKKR